jgi:hypothetical protein
MPPRDPSDPLNANLCPSCINMTANLQNSTWGDPIDPCLKESSWRPLILKEEILVLPKEHQTQPREDENRPLKRKC